MRWDEEERRWLWDVDGHKTRRQRRVFCSEFIIFCTTVSVDSSYSRGKYWQNMIELKRAEWNIWKEVEDRHWLPVCKSSSWKTKQSKLPIIFIEKYETDNWLGLDICGSVAVWSLASQRARFLPLLQPGVGWAVWPVWLRWGCFYVDY